MLFSRSAGVSVLRSDGRLPSPIIAMATMLAILACAPVPSLSTPESRRREANGAAELTGAWRLVATAVREPGKPWSERPAPQGGLFVFSKRHYSYFYVRGAAPRPLFADANRPTEAERAATFDTFIAGAGSYTFDGRTTLLKADYRKNPNEATGAIWRWETERAGDTLRMVFPNPPFLPGVDWRITLVRLE